jgi:acyl transferase domain-containing protein
MDEADIAIIGMGCRLPGGANDPYTFFQKLKQGFILYVFIRFYFIVNLLRI